MKTKTLWKLHSAIGLIVAMPLLLIAVTGSVLVFHSELDELSRPELAVVEPTPQGRLGFDVMAAAIGASLPGHDVVGWHILEDAHRADEVYLWARGQTEWLRVYIDPYRAQLRGQPQPRDFKNGFMDWLVELHYSFLGGHLGILLGGIIALLLCVLGVLGFFIFKQFWIGFFTLRWHKSLRVLMADLHTRIGVLSSPVFLILGITGAYWNLTHAIGELYMHGLAEEQEVPMTESLYNRDLSLDRLVLEVRKTMPGYTPYYLALPHEEGGKITFYGAVPTSNFLRSPYGSVASFEPFSGKLLSSYDIREAAVLPQVVDTFMRLHFGNFAGLPVKLLWCVLGLMPGVLALSGSYIWFKRTRRHARRRKLNTIVEVNA